MKPGGRRLLVVRPEPGNARTVAAARALGFDAEAMALFAVAPLAWTPPDAAGFDALVLTSANTPRHGGDGLASLASLPVLAVGEATAAAARSAGFTVASTGTMNAAALAEEARARGWHRLLHLGGRERTELPGATSIAVYASEALPPPAGAAARLAEATVLLHSARAARAVADLAADRAATAIVAISPAVLAAAGTGWAAAATAPAPTDAALLAAARLLLDRSSD